MKSRVKIRNFHQAKWDEQIIFELSRPGERGVWMPLAEKEITSDVAVEALIPPSLKRKDKLKLPEINQKRVLTHYLRLSQMTLGGNINPEIGQGTCTVKYNPPVNELIVRTPKMMELHPLQDTSTTQGILQIMYELDLYFREISGMDKVSFQSGGGSQAIFMIASIVRKYHEKLGQAEQKDEIITTLYSHPSDAAAPAVKGYKVIYVPADEEGYPDLEAFKQAVSERTAAFFIANPEDTGIFNKRILEFTKLVHEAGGLNCYDQANANGLIGITRAREAGFDMCFFNLHKTFGTPHGCGGPGSGAVGVTDELIEFLPNPTVEKIEGKYELMNDNDEGIGKIHPFYGNPQNAVKAYAWIRTLGADGIRAVAQVAALNNNYLLHKLLEHKGVGVSFDKNPGQRVEQVRYTLEKLKQDTGFGSDDVARRVMDFGMHIWSSHHPYYIPEPLTLEPTETPSKDDLDEYIMTLKHILDECYDHPEIIESAPNNSTIHRTIEDNLDDETAWIPSWKVYQQQND